MDLREFLDRVEGLGELRIIEGANWQWEIGALTYSVAAGLNPPALLFDKVEGFKTGYRVLTIPFSTDNRLALLFGQQPGITGLEIVKGLRDRLRQPFEPISPVEVKEGPIMENILTGAEVDLFKFPTPQWQPLDGGRYIGTGDTVIMKDPDEGWVNLGAHRVQIHDKSTATIKFFSPTRHGDVIRKKYWAKGQSCPAVVTCGGDPLLHTIASVIVPWGVSEYDYTGWLQKKPLEVIKGPTTGLPIPAYDEIALEGEMVPPEVETRIEGPFSENTGHYSPAASESAFKVKCILHRNDPIILAVLPFLGAGVICYGNLLMRAALVWAKLDEVVPGVKGVWRPAEFGANQCVVISLQQKYNGHAKEAAAVALTVNASMQKYVIVVDDDVDPSNIREVLFAIGLRAEPEEFDILRGWRGSWLNPRLSPQKRAIGDLTTSSAIILACKPYSWIKEFPASIRPSPEFRDKVREKWGKLAI